MAEVVTRSVAAIWRRIFPPSGPGQYRVLRRRMTFLLILVSVVPLALMAAINYHQHQRAIRARVVAPLSELLNRTRHSCEIFLAERRSALSFLASTHSQEELSDERMLGSVFQMLKRDFGGFVDLGLIDSSGRQVSYAGPYDLLGKDYREQDWFAEVRIRDTYVSDVFLGYRNHPHFVIAVQHLEPTGASWIVRATIDTEKFNSLITPVDQEPGSDAFVINRAGVLQTPSRIYGPAMSTVPIDLPEGDGEPRVIDAEDKAGRGILIGSIEFESVPFTLVTIKPRGAAWRPWHTLENELFLIFIAGTLLILLVVYLLASAAVRRIEQSERRQRLAFLEMEHSNKLASVGRLAAGVAHEINNPLAIIDQKAGLMVDLLEREKESSLSARFVELTASVQKAVDRCRKITHRLLGFARRMDVDVTPIDLNEVVREVLSFLEKEALHRSIEVSLDLDTELPRIASDSGQLQQVFLNILTNAFAAVENGGKVAIRSREDESGRVSVMIEDDGTGMDAETMRQIFEPFFTTKGNEGTGLGLSVTYGIVKRLGGDIMVRSTLGQGSTFTVILPRESPRGRGD